MLMPGSTALGSVLMQRQDKRRTSSGSSSETVNQRCLDLLRGLRGAGTHEDLQECSQHSDNGLVLMDGASDEVSHRKQHGVIHRDVFKYTMWCSSTPRVTTSAALLLKKNGIFSNQYLSNVDITKCKDQHKYCIMMHSETLVKIISKCVGALTKALLVTSFF